MKGVDYRGLELLFQPPFLYRSTPSELGLLGASADGLTPHRAARVLPAVRFPYLPTSEQRDFSPAAAEGCGSNPQSPYWLGGEKGVGGGCARRGSPLPLSLLSKSKRDGPFSLSLQGPSSPVKGVRGRVRAGKRGVRKRLHISPRQRVLWCSPTPLFPLSLGQEF